MFHIGQEDIRPVKSEAFVDFACAGTMPVSRQARTEATASFKHKMIHMDCESDAEKLGAHSMG